MADDTPWLSPGERRAWLGLVAVAELLPGRLDQQLQRDAGLTHFEYQVLAMLSEAPGRALRMTALARRTNATLPRLSHVVKRLEQRGLVERAGSPQDRRATDAHLTDAGWAAVVAAAPGHVRTARALTVDALTPEDVEHLTRITAAMLRRLDPEGRMTPPD
ncbi:MarR family winged helix-turn-helix transcriptional regulator [Cellulomonas sp. NPDC057328]|uniref:MarR family winged helix-turn-helix transcriptional regulator n=1 Tax=Cellulomonas sp. NPDC057328 TaxID=3346101 RepID=UPI003627151D